MNCENKKPTIGLDPWLAFVILVSKRKICAELYP